MRLSSQTRTAVGLILYFVNRWNVQIVLEALNYDTITWAMSDAELEQLRADIDAGELGRAHIKRIVPIRDVSLVAAA